ncbi:serine hydrolase domain-containing protein [Ralstonia mojiangensis]|uniref:serine hydrolase domain-containing protein n=1 Tax=Ralstonia mojiangensis TaxID=2953895 RepID=UPI002090623B|nr:serine hydrolase domain-containing protein [Ralstonia mojiangensis]MCO5413330.1 beta-lactamase family protein [Ralstonia mojiangensis]
MNSSLAARLDALFAPYQRSDTPGLVVGITHGAALRYRRGFGMASLEHSVANTPCTRMRIGSVTKHFACLAAMLLVEAGKLDIDVPARRYLPELPARNSDPTLRQFMNHSGGERCFLDLFMLTQGLSMVPAGAALAMQARQSEHNFPAGERAMYTNGGYQMLSIVIERISGMSFEAFLAEHLFGPMGMIDTIAAPHDMQILPGMATLHVRDATSGWERGLLPGWRCLGEGAIVSTADDMLGWIAHLRSEKRIGSAATWREMLTPVRFFDGEIGTYSLGLMQTRYRGVSMLHHSGGSIGGACQMLTVPEHALDIVIMTNADTIDPIALSKRVIDIMLEAHLTTVESRPATSVEYPAWLGTYHSCETGAYCEIVDRDGTLHLIHHNLVIHPLPLKLVPNRPRTLALDEGPEGALYLKLHSDGRRLDMTQCGQSQTLDRLANAALHAADAANGLVGRYLSLDADALAIIKQESNALAMSVQGRHGAAHYRLDPKSNDMLAFTPHAPSSMAYGAMRLSRDSGGNISCFRLDTWRTRNLLFTRIDDDTTP